MSLWDSVVICWYSTPLRLHLAKGGGMVVVDYTCEVMEVEVTVCLPWNYIAAAFRHRE